MSPIVLASTLTVLVLVVVLAIVLVVVAIVRHHPRRTHFVHPHVDYRGYMDEPRMTPDPKGWADWMRRPR